MSKFFQAIGQQSLHRRNTLKLMLGGLAASALSGCSNALVRKGDQQHSLIVGATRTPDSSYALTAITPAGRIVFQHDLPARGHGLAYNPQQQHICVFARRPGDYFDVVDRHSGQLIQRVNAERPRFSMGMAVIPNQVNGCLSVKARGQAAREQSAFTTLRVGTAKCRKSILMALVHIRLKVYPMRCWCVRLAE